MTEQKLPALEPGHTAPGLTLPRVEGQGVKDDVQTSDYPKWIAHPIHGSVLAKDADHEAAILAEIEALPKQVEEVVAGVESVVKDASGIAATVGGMIDKAKALFSGSTPDTQAEQAKQQASAE